MPGRSESFAKIVAGMRKDRRWILSELDKRPKLAIRIVRLFLSWDDRDLNFDDRSIFGGYRYTPLTWSTYSKWGLKLSTVRHIMERVISPLVRKKVKDRHPRKFNRKRGR